MISESDLLGSHFFHHTKTLLRRCQRCLIFPSRISGQGSRQRSVCVSICLSALSWLNHFIYIQTWNSVPGLTLTISRMSLKLKVIGQRSRSLGWQMWFSDFQMCWPVQVHLVICPEQTFNELWLLWFLLTPVLPCRCNLWIFFLSSSLLDSWKVWWRKFAITDWWAKLYHYSKA